MVLGFFMLYLEYFYSRMWSLIINSSWYQDINCLLCWLILVFFIPLLSNHTVDHERDLSCVCTPHSSVRSSEDSPVLLRFSVGTALFIALPHRFRLPWLTCILISLFSAKLVYIFLLGEHLAVHGQEIVSRQKPLPFSLLSVITNV